MNINRLFIVPAPKDDGTRISLPPPISEDKKIEVISKIDKIVSSITPNYVMPVSDNAKKLFDEWYINIPHSEFNTRIDTYAHRFKVLLALNDYKKEVDLKTMEKVIDICNWQLLVRKKFAPIDVDNINAQFEKRIRNFLRDRPQLYSNIKHELKRQILRNGVGFLTRSLKRLEEADVIKKVKSERGALAYELIEVDRG